ncbi:hypothetical protein MTO96_017277 [Rhipicephalus appendiculatus]
MLSPSSPDDKQSQAAVSSGGFAWLTRAKNRLRTFNVLHGTRSRTSPPVTASSPGSASDSSPCIGSAADLRSEATEPSVNNNAPDLATASRSPSSTRLFHNRIVARDPPRPSLGESRFSKSRSVPRPKPMILVKRKLGARTGAECSSLNDLDDIDANNEKWKTFGSAYSGEQRLILLDEAAKRCPGHEDAEESSNGACPGLMSRSSSLKTDVARHDQGALRIPRERARHSDGMRWLSEDDEEASSPLGALSPLGASSRIGASSERGSCSRSTKSQLPGIFEADPRGCAPTQVQQAVVVRRGRRVHARRTSHRRLILRRRVSRAPTALRAKSSADHNLYDDLKWLTEGSEGNPKCEILFGIGEDRAISWSEPSCPSDGVEILAKMAGVSDDIVSGAALSPQPKTPELLSEATLSTFDTEAEQSHPSEAGPNAVSTATQQSKMKCLDNSHARGVGQKIRGLQQESPSLVRSSQHSTRTTASDMDGNGRNDIPVSDNSSVPDVAQAGGRNEVVRRAGTLGARQTRDRLEEKSEGACANAEKHCARDIGETVQPTSSTASKKEAVSRLMESMRLVDVPGASWDVAPVSSVKGTPLRVHEFHSDDVNVKDSGEVTLCIRTSTRRKSAMVWPFGTTSASRSPSPPQRLLHDKD